MYTVTSPCLLPHQFQHFSGTSVALQFHLVMQAGEFRREKEAVEQQTNELNKRLRNLKVSTCKVIGKETQRTGSTGCLEACINGTLIEGQLLYASCRSFMHFTSWYWRPGSPQAEIQMLEQTLEEQRTKDPKQLEAKFSKEA